jgi:TRAP-type C4-dicarboxylate transport system substrate-binding protein
MAGSEIYGALEKGVVDGADFSAYANNDAGGFHKVAKYPLYPGIHSMPVLQFTLNKKVWDKMSKQDQMAIEQWYQDMYAGLTAATDAKDKELVARDKAAGDLTIIDWPQAERDKFRAIAVQAWEKAAAASPEAKEAYETHLRFMKAKGLLKAD